MGVLKQQKKSIKKTARFAVGQSKNMFKRSRKDLKTIRKDVVGFIGSQNQAINKRYGETSTGLSAINSNLQSSLSNQSAAAKSAAMSELQRLGLQGVGLNQFNADAANQQAVASQLGANEQANLSAMRYGDLSIGNLLKGMAHGSYQSQLGTALNTRNDDISLIRQKRGDALQQLIMQMRGNKGGSNAGSSGSSGYVSSGSSIGPSAAIQRIIDEAKKRKLASSGLSGGGGGAGGGPAAHIQ